MRVRREQMQRHYNESTYRAIEAEIARKALAEREKSVPKPETVERVCDIRSAEEIAKAAAQALKGQAA
jgi:predicted nucleotide-binding protein